MGLFSRRDRPPQPADGSTPGIPDADEPAGDPPADPVIHPVTAQDQAAIEAAVRELEARGIDLTDIDQIGAAYDEAAARWLTEHPHGDGDPGEITDLFAYALGEHLRRVSSVDWAHIEDAFGTDLGVAGGRRGFYVIPGNLVAGRWMRGETGWLPAVMRTLRARAGA